MVEGGKISSQGGATTAAIQKPSPARDGCGRSQWSRPTVGAILMTKTEMQAEALANARNGESWSNYPTIFAGFIEKGIPEYEIKPRENVFTFHAWKALGRSVKKGEHGVKVVTFIDCAGRERDPSSGEEKETSYRRPHTTVVFHIFQTELTAEREERKHASRTPRRSAWASGHGRYPTVDKDYDPGYVDPGELAADRWNETH
jgi:N-terminal domain of anti-restriction factor ArdC